jgi:alpha-amylase
MSEETKQPLLETPLNEDLDESEFSKNEKNTGFLSSLSLNHKIAIAVGSVIFIAAFVFACYFLSRKEDSTESGNINSDTYVPNTSNDALPDCQIYSDPTCSGSSKIMPDGWETHLWNTPHPGDDDYLESFQDMYVLQGYAQLRYSSDRKSCTVNVYTKTAKDLKLYYYFDGVKQEESSKTFDSSYTGQLQIVVKAETGERLELEEVDFIWNTIKELPSRTGDYRNGQKGAVVEMFGWPDDQIAKECKVIAEAGYLGVKLFPHMEQVMSWQPFENALNPWYFMYQPVSYSLNGRMGNRSTLRKMIQTCRSYGLRVYADAVVNHMSGNGNDMNYHRNPSAGCTYWPPKTSSGELVNKTSPYYTPGYTYQINPHTQQGTNVLEYPRVPYGPMDFHCEKSLNSWSDPNILDSGWLTGLTDLDTSSDYVRQRIADHFVDLMSIGFSGFRVDAAKHICPDDLAAIFGKFKKAMGGSYPEDYFSWLEVLTGGEGSLLVGGDSSYSYTTYLAKRLQEEGLTDTEIDQVKLWWAPYPVEPFLDNGRLSTKRKVIQNDDHDQQNPGSSSRDMHDSGCVLVKGCSPDTHRSFEVKLFTNPNGASDNDNDYPIRMVLSSYYFPSSGVMSPPDGLSDCSLCKFTCDNCQSREYVAAYQENAKAYEGSDYTRVHRDEQIIAAMRSWMHIN